MNKPDGTKMLATLVELLAEQHGVKIACDIEGRKKDEKEVQNP